MKRKSFVLLIAIGVLMPSLTACTIGDLLELEEFVEAWAEAKGTKPTNPSGVINAGLSQANVIGEGDVVAVLDVEGTVDSIKAADEAATKAQGALNTGQPQLAVNFLDAAMKDRPNDWWLLDHRGVANIEAGHSDDGRYDLKKASEGLNARQLEHQRQLLSESIARHTQNRGLAFCAAYSALADAYTHLALLAQGQEKDFFLSKRSEYSSAASQPGVTCR